MCGLISRASVHSMRVNEQTALLTDRVLLVPYSRHHVPTYHAWMQDDEIREATASEPLTLDEEYAMQRSWRCDADKLTFIVCLAPEDRGDASASASRLVKAGVEDADARMVGDVNLFVAEYEGSEGDEGGGSSSSSTESDRVVGELEVMIARRECQGRGLGRHILLTFIWYVLGSWEAIAKEHSGKRIERCAELFALCAKIGAGNGRSIKLFERLGFNKTATQPNYFGEWELRWVKDRANRDKLMTLVVEEIGEPKVIRYQESTDDG